MSIKYTFYNFIMLCTFIAMVLGIFNSCSTPSETASRLFDKANRKDEPTVAGKCGQMFPPISGKDSIVIYKAGEEIIRYDTLTFVDIMNDTVYRYVNKYITKHDTLQTTKTVTVHNEAKEQELSADLLSCKGTVSGQKSVLNICYWAIGILGIYTLGRWILRIWKIKLP